MKHLVIIPAYNEEAALADTVADLQRLPAGFDLLVVNDGSTDHTGRIAEQLARTSQLPLRVVHLPSNYGIGVAVQTGYSVAARAGGYTYAIQFDADGQHDAAAIPRLIDACEKAGLDLCVGSRFLIPHGPGFHSTFARRIGIAFLIRLIRALSGLAITDPTSGFRCAGPRVWRQFARGYPEDYPEPESLFWCARHHLRVGEVPVQMRARRGGRSSIDRLCAAYYMLKVSLAILFDRVRAAEFR
jgi:glycosyltransferase involved in cell wall biosynthesis